MAPIKFEDNIREKLEGRRLKPSAEAWSTLSDRLDKHEARKNHKPLWWLGIAASIIGIVFVANQFFTKEEKTQPAIVDSPTKIEQNLEKRVEDLNSVADETLKIEKEVEEKVVTIKTETLKKEPLRKTKLVEPIILVAEEIKSEGEKNTIESPAETLNPTFEEQKIQEVVAKVQDLKNSKQPVTNADIEALLQEAQKEIRLNQLINETNGVVDANMLLQDVEAELEQSFRSKVFEALKTSFNSVKTAVAQRNQ